MNNAGTGKTVADWVDVADRMPGEDGPYLIFAPSADRKSPLIMKAWYDPEERQWSQLNAYWAAAITHWAELPAPPR